VAGAAGVGARHGGASALWGDGFRWQAAGPVAAFVAWFCSSGQREEADGVLLGWQHARLPNGPPLLWHTGGTGGYASWYGLVKETQTGVVLSNSANRVDGLGERILRCVQELPEEDEV
jgi:hypothetical protein